MCLYVRDLSVDEGQVVSQLETNYHETIVEIKMENLTLRQLVDFLCKIQSSKALVGTQSLYIKKNLTNTNQLDSTIEIRNLEPIQN